MSLPRENVQHYPRPPLVEPAGVRLTASLGGAAVFDTEAGWRVCETHHAPTYYIPPDAIAARLTPCSGTSFCEWKGRAQYFDITAGGVTRRKAAWAYPAPTDRFAAIAGFVAFYPGMLDEARVGGVRVTPQPGDFYGGWVTPNLDGMVKGGPGTLGW